MTSINETHEQWSMDDMVEITLQQPDDFLILKETLTRLGVASKKSQTLYQTAHVLYKRSKYYIVMYKELFGLDGKEVRWTRNDIQRRNRIIKLLADWNLVTVVDPSKITDMAPLNQIKVLSHKDKADWTLESKYQIGAKKKFVDTEQ